jgi:hypothetical protein
LGLQTFKFNSNASDTNLDNCTYTLFNSLGLVDGLNLNISFTCNDQISVTSSSFGTFNLSIYAYDKLNNFNQTYSLVVLTSLGGTTSGGGGGETMMVKAVVLIRPIGESLYPNLDRAKIYTGIYKYCINHTVFGKCSQTEESLETLILSLNTNYKMLLTEDKLRLWINQYDLKKIENVEISKKDADTWKLIVAEIVITPEKFAIVPTRIDTVKFILGGEVVNVQTLSNRPLKSCEKIFGDVGFSCSVLNTTAQVIYLIPPDWNFAVEVVNAQFGYTNMNEETVYQDVQFRIFGRGVTISIIVGIGLILLAGLLFRNRLKKSSTSFGNWIKKGLKGGSESKTPKKREPALFPSKMEDRNN